MPPVEIVSSAAKLSFCNFPCRRDITQDKDAHTEVLKPHTFNIM